MIRKNLVDPMGDPRGCVVRCGPGSVFALLADDPVPEILDRHSVAFGVFPDGLLIVFDEGPLLQRTNHQESGKLPL